MIFFSIDKQRGKVNVERMSRPIDSINNNKKSIARLGLDIRGAVTYFCFSAEKKLLSGLIIGGAYTITILALCFYHCSSQDLTSSITLSIKVDKEYTVTKTKDFYAMKIQENGYMVNSDSVKQNYYDINIEIKNISDRPISLWLMKCSYTDNFLVNNNYISFRGQECNGNYPIQVKFKPGESKSYKTTLVKSIKFDYPCQHCVYGPQVVTTKIGLIVIDDIFESKFNDFDYDLAMNDKSKWRIVWSNSLQLLGKQPEPNTLPIKE